MTNRNDIEQLFKAHYAQMRRLAVVLLHDDDLARDIVHDVFASLLDAPLEVTITGGYLIRAVKNRCLNHIRDCEIHQRIANRYFLENEEYDTEDWLTRKPLRGYTVLSSQKYHRRQGASWSCGSPRDCHSAA